MIDPKTFKAPALTIPTPEEYIAAQKKLAIRLKLLAKELGYDEPAAFGKMLADAQDPPREHCPYSSAIVQDWYNGKLTPSQTVMDTLHDLCMDEYEEQYENLYDAWDIASQSLKDLQYRYSKALLSTLKISRGDLATQITNQCDSLTPGTISNITNCTQKVNGNFIDALTETLTSINIPPDEVKTVRQHYQELAALGTIAPIAQATEFSRSLTHAQKYTGIRQDKLPYHLAHHGYTTHNGKPA